MTEAERREIARIAVNMKGWEDMLRKNKCAEIRRRANKRYKILDQKFNELLVKYARALWEENNAKV